VLNIQTELQKKKFCFSTFSVPWAAGTHTDDGSSRYAHTISRHADGISRYSVPPSAGPLLPLQIGLLGVATGKTRVDVHAPLLTQDVPRER